MKKITSIFLLGLFVLAFVTSCSQKTIHTSKDRPESYAAFVQKN